MDINKVLDESAGQISRIGTEAEESRFLWQESKERLKQMEAKSYLTIKAENDGMAVKEVEAHISSDDSIYQQKMSVITHESEYRKLEVTLEGWKEALNSAKMIGRLKIAEMGSLHGTVSQQ